MVGNPLLISSNQQTVQTNNYFYKQLIHSDLQEKYFFKLLINNQTTFKKLLINPSLHGFIFLVNSDKLPEIENTIAHRSGPIVPSIDLQENKLTGGLLANPKNLYLISTERTISTNTTAMGGNTSLYSLVG